MFQMLAALYLVFFATCMGIDSVHGSKLVEGHSNHTHKEPDMTPACISSKFLEKACKSQHGQHCHCMPKFLQDKGDCMVGKAGANPMRAAFVMFWLDAEKNKCQALGVKTDDVQLSLSPPALAIVQMFRRRDNQLRQEQTAFLALQIAGGHIGLVVILLFSIFYRKNHRDPTFINFCITWIFSSVVFSLLLYRGTRGNTFHTPHSQVPSSDICLTQAALTNGAQVMTACSTMALTIQLWLGLRTALHRSTPSPRIRRWTTIVLVVTPYVLFLAFTIPTALIGQRHITVKGSSFRRVLPTTFYCMLADSNPFVQIVYGFTLGLLVITVVFDGLIIRILYSHWWAFLHLPTKGAISLSPLVRIIIFSLYRIGVAVAYGSVLCEPPKILKGHVFFFDPRLSIYLVSGVPTWVELFQAAIPLIAFLLLGVHSDTIASLMFWRKKGRDQRTLQSEDTAGPGPVNNAWDELDDFEADTKHVAMS